MGWRICGIVINKNFSNDHENLLNLLGVQKDALLKESSFENETIDILSDNELAIGFFGKGTLLLTGIELMTNDSILSKSSTNLSILAFYMDEITSTYCFDFYNNGAYKRKHWISLTDKGIDSSDNFGQPLKEETETDYFENIFRIISSLLEEDFFLIKENASMLKFSIKKQLNESKSPQKKGFWSKLFKK